MGGGPREKKEKRRKRINSSPITPRGTFCVKGRERPLRKNILSGIKMNSPLSWFSALIFAASFRGFPMCRSALLSNLSLASFQLFSSYFLAFSLPVRGVLPIPRPAPRAAPRAAFFLFPFLVLTMSRGSRRSQTPAQRRRDQKDR